LICSASFLLDGATLMIASGNFVVLGPDPRRRSPPSLEHPSKVERAAISRDGVTVATGGEDKVIWDLAKGTAVGEPLSCPSH
jgi:hypothetical protein